MHTNLLWKRGRSLAVNEKSIQDNVAKYTKATGYEDVDWKKLAQDEFQW